MMASIVELLKEYKLTNIEDSDENGNTLFHLAVKYEKFTQKEIVEVLEILLDKGVDPSVKNKNDETILQLAINKRMKDVVEILLIPEDNIDSAAHFFIDDEYAKFDNLSKQFDEQDDEIQKIESESVAFVEFLISKGVDFSRKYERNESALRIAMNRNLLHILPALFKCTNDISFVDRGNVTLLHLFLEKKGNRHGIDEKWYSKRYKADIVKILLERGISSDAEDNCKRTPIRLAIENEEDIDGVEALLERSKKVNHKNYEGATLLNKLTRKWAMSRDANTDYHYMKIADVLIAKGADVNEPDSYGQTPLFYAVKMHNLRVVRYLRDNGADFRVTAKDGRTLMHQLVESSSFAKSENDEDEMTLLDLLIEHLTNVHYKYSISGETLLHVVIQKWSMRQADTDYYMKIAGALVDKGANVNELNPFGITPLGFAVKTHNLHAVEFLRKNGADFTIITKNNDTMMHLFVNYDVCEKPGIEEAEMTLFELLLDCSTNNINHKNSRGETSFNMMIKKWTLANDVEYDFYKRIAQALIARGADLNEPDKFEKRPVHYAVERHNLRVVEFLKNNGIDFSLKTKDGDSLMHLFVNGIDCAKTDDNEAKMSLLDLLLERSTRIDEKNSEGQTVFHTLIREWTTSKDHGSNDFYMKVGNALIAKGANVNEVDREGKTPLQHAVEKHKLCVVKFLEENGADFGITTRNGRSLMHLLVESSDYMKTGDEEEEEKEEEEMNLFELLMSKGCQVDARDNSGTMPLHVAAMHSNARVVRMLIEHGARVNCRNKQMETPLHFATKNLEFADIAEVLRERGANVNAQNREGRTALHKIACEPVTEHSCTRLWILFQQGADVNVTDRQNRSAFSCAHARNREDCERRRREYIREKYEARRRDYYVNDDNSPSDLNSDEEERLEEKANSVMICLAEHSIKLKAANLPWDKQIKNFHGDYGWDYSGREFYQDNNEECMHEIEKLKSTFIDNHTSLYNLLHLDLNSKCAYINNEKLQQLVHCPELHKQFPKYGVLILASFHEAVTRKALLESSKIIWLELTEIDLPDICIECIFSFLSNPDLFAFIEQDQKVSEETKILSMALRKLLDDQLKKRSGRRNIFWL